MLQTKLDDLKIINNHYTITEDLSLKGNVFLDHKHKFMNDKFFKDIKGKRYLDIGCNAGYFPILAMQHGAREAFGIDKSANYIGIAKEVANAVGVAPRLYEEKFTENILRFGVFDAISLNSLYHYIFLDTRSHDVIFRILSLMTDNLFFENPLGMEDPVISKICGEGNPILATEYTKEKIIGAASKYFNCEYLADHLYPDRKIYWMTRKRGVLDLTEFSSKEQIHANHTHTYYKVTLPGINRIMFLKRRAPMDTFPISTIITGITYYMQNLSDIEGINICYDYRVDSDGYINILLDYIDGYVNIYTVPAQDKKSIILQVMNILGQMAKRGFINIDPSPLNFFQKSGDVKMIDLDGIQKYTDCSESLLAQSYSRIMDILKWV